MKVNIPESREDGGASIEEEDDEDLVNEITEKDLTYLRAVILDADKSMKGDPPIQCDNLGDPPDPNDIPDVFSCVLGDPFHPMDRPKPSTIKHEVKKAYYFAFMTAIMIWDEDKMDELRKRMKAHGLTDDDIDKRLYFNTDLFKGCVPRKIPPPSILYWRVRAVFATYGSMKDSKTNQPLFNKQAWGKARHLLKEIRAGLYSDPPGMEMYTFKLKKDGSVKKNKYGMEMFDCIRGTSRTEAYHKGLVTTFGSWPCGLEFSDDLKIERRHRHNTRVSEMRQMDFPTIGHFNSWLTDALQNLVWKNHRVQLYPGWTNASDYKDTLESFDTVALHCQVLEDALEARWRLIDKSIVKLTRDQQYGADSMGVKLPFLPFITEEENIQFAECALDDTFPFQNDLEAAIAWCKYVDGVNIFPKLPVYIQMHRDQFERNQRVRDSVTRAAKGQSALDRLNSVLKPAKSSDDAHVEMPKSLPTVHAAAMHAQ